MPRNIPTTTFACEIPVRGSFSQFLFSRWLLCPWKTRKFAPRENFPLYSTVSRLEQLMQVFIVSLRVFFSSLMPCLQFQNNSFIEFTTHPYPGISYPPIEEDRSATMPRLDGRKAKLRQGSHLSALPGSEEHLSGRQAAIQLYQLVKSVSIFIA